MTDTNLPASRAYKARSPEYIERKRVREAEKRRIAREAKGFSSAEEFRRFALAQARKLRAARTVIQPSIAKRQKLQAVNKPGQSFEDWKANGGVVEVLPTQWGTNPGPAPVRHFPKAGLL